MNQHIPNRKAALLVTACIMLVVAVLLSIGLGSVRLTLAETIETLLGHGDAASQTILWDIRIPRIFLALLIGANLAASGALLQAVMQNPLADPGLTGVSSGAAVTVLFIMLVVPDYSYLIPLAAIIGGGVAAGMVYSMAWKKQGGLTPVRIILSGVAVNAVFGGAIGLLSILYSDKLPGALQWMNGSLSGKGMGDVMVMLPYSIVGWIAALLSIRQANILRLGEQVAHNLGQNLHRLRLSLSIIAVYLAAVSVSTVGLVGFIGLVVPHMARMLVGSDYRLCLPFSLVLGSLVLLVADTFGRTAFAPLEIPAGIVMAIVGGPYFLYLMRKGGM
ncbi:MULTISPECIES: FecCD family ABC transporter permease [Brevibacillus]|uniref:FecCD family ABC transporter permease n=1 Tax=Brevibacillus TaxID=55080 RepID=UPI000D10B0BE|nr:MULTISPECIES: iron ABC transporter permease [Brevibacillus]PSJ67637.1 iron ABC transporter permease [Brevibacillus brevis]RED28190.1 iron complex transport system permease protein [Brevibacillus brevis]TQK74147.1 iron complex transport system permease protein [Brevibacillus sp. AG162]VEF90886.1 Probable siderophore transport system permease protein yfhA [Brevibacillus brevis]GEC90476.1 ferrichrome ABC transporter [Brevibacillus brevis]